MILPITSNISVPQHAGNNPRRFFRKAAARREQDGFRKDRYGPHWHGIILVNV